MALIYRYKMVFENNSIEGAERLASGHDRHTKDLNSRSGSIEVRGPENQHFLAQ